MRAVLCSCVFAMFRMSWGGGGGISYILYACIPLVCIVLGICALYVLFHVVKRFEFPKVLYKFPIIVIVNQQKVLKTSHLLDQER